MVIRRLTIQFQMPSFELSLCKNGLFLCCCRIMTRLDLQNPGRTYARSGSGDSFVFWIASYLFRTCVVVEKDTMNSHFHDSMHEYWLSTRNQRVLLTATGEPKLQLCVQHDQRSTEPSAVARSV